MSPLCLHQLTSVFGLKFLLLTSQERQSRKTAKMMNKLKGFVKKALKLVTATFATLTFLVTVYILGKRKGKIETVADNKTVTKAKEIKNKTEEKIEKTDAHNLAADSPDWQNHLRNKERLRKKFGDDADDIAEAFLRG